MEIAAELMRRRHVLQDVLRESGRLDGRQPDAFHTGDGVQSTNHVQKIRSFAVISADVHPGEDHFLMPLGGKGFRLMDDVRQNPAAFMAAGKRNDAEAAHEIAAVLNL